MSTRKLNGLIAVTMLAVACTMGANQGQTPTTDYFAPTPTIGDPITTTSIRAPRTTPPDVEKALLLKVDRFLTPEPGYPGIPMGDWWYGDTSPDHRWLLAQVGHDNGSGEIRLVDVLNWRTVGSWPEGWTQGQAVTDDGIGYLVVGVADVPGADTPSPRLLRVRPGREDPEGVAELPQGFSTWGQVHVDAAGRVLILGFTSLDPELGGGPATLVIFEPGTGSLSEIPLPSTQVGTVERIDIGEDYGGYVDVVPGVVWDDHRSRVLVANSDSLNITVIDTETGQVQDHSFTVPGWSEERPSGGATSSVAFSPDGTRLFISRTESSYEVEETSWSRSTISKGVAVIDTESWTVTNQTDAAIGWIVLSPDGSHLLGSSYQTVESDSGYSSTAQPTLDLDPETLDMQFQLEPPNEGDFSGISSFDRSSTIGYVSWWDSIQHVNAIQLETGLIMTSREGNQVLVLGEAGLMGISR